jgi:hypothetical protein
VRGAADWPDRPGAGGDRDTTFVGRGLDPVAGTGVLLLNPYDVYRLRRTDEPSDSANETGELALRFIAGAATRE